VEEIRTLKEKLEAQKTKTKTARERRRRERERRRATDSKLLEAEGQLERSRKKCLAQQSELNAAQRKQKMNKAQTVGFGSEWSCTNDVCKAAQMLRVASSTRALRVV
jgi:chromosome segregation ATPase